MKGIEPFRCCLL